MKAIKNLFLPRKNLEETATAQGTLLNFTYDGRSTVSIFDKSESEHKLLTRGKPDAALESLNNALGEVYTLNSFVYKNTWPEEDVKKDRPFSRANRLVESLTEMSNNQKLALKNLEIEGLDFSLTKEDGRPREVHSPLNDLTGILIKNQNLETLNLKSNNMKLFDVKALLVRIPEKMRGVITVDTFANQTQDSMNQQKIDEAVIEYIQKPRRLTNEMGSAKQQEQAVNSGGDLKPSHLEESERKQSQESLTGNSSPRSSVAANEVTNPIQQKQSAKPSNQMDQI